MFFAQTHYFSRSVLNSDIFFPQNSNRVVFCFLFLFFLHFVSNKEAKQTKKKALSKFCRRIFSRVGFYSGVILTLILIAIRRLNCHCFSIFLSPRRGQNKDRIETAGIISSLVPNQDAPRFPRLLTLNYQLVEAEFLHGNTLFVDTTERCAPFLKRAFI